MRRKGSFFNNLLASAGSKIFGVPPRHYGFRIDVEIEKGGYDFLHSSAFRGEGELRMMLGNYEEKLFSFDELVPLAFVENQGSIGSCQGQSGTTGTEWLVRIAGGPTVALSRMMLYILSQDEDGLTGQDKGSTISAGVKVLTTVGVAEETFWEYPDRYTARKPGNMREVLENAENYRVARAVDITSYDAARAHLGSNQGPIHCGINWNGSVDRARVDEYDLRETGGGHAIELLALLDILDSAGRPYLCGINSWGTGWGKLGFFIWSPKAFETMTRHHHNVFMGLMGTPNIEPKPIRLSSISDQLFASFAKRVLRSLV